MFGSFIVLLSCTCAVTRRFYRLLYACLLQSWSPQVYLFPTWDVQFRDTVTQIKFNLKFISPIPLPSQPFLLRLSHLTDAPLGVTAQESSQPSHFLTAILNRRLTLAWFPYKRPFAPRREASACSGVGRGCSSRLTAPACPRFRFASL